tara:strand:+ start:5933 stop:6448 length:516 start_codon:yes stop_codon:yes gene_type:complete
MPQTRTKPKPKPKKKKMEIKLKMDEAFTAAIVALGAALLASSGGGKSATPVSKPGKETEAGIDPKAAGKQKPLTKAAIAKLTKAAKDKALRIAKEQPDDGKADKIGPLGTSIIGAICKKIGCAKVSEAAPEQLAALNAQLDLAIANLDEKLSAASEDDEAEAEEEESEIEL